MRFYSFFDSHMCLKMGNWRSERAIQHFETIVPVRKWLKLKGGKGLGIWDEAHNRNDLGTWKRQIEGLKTIHSFLA